MTATVGVIVFFALFSLAIVTAFWLESQDTGHKDDPTTLKAERDEADRRAGAAERELERLRKQERDRDEWLAEAKMARGYSRYETFDRVWEETCALADEAEALKQERKP